MIEQPSDQPSPRITVAGRATNDSSGTTLAAINCGLGGLQLFGAGFFFCAHLLLSVLGLPFQMYAGLGADPKAETPFGARAQVAMISAIVQIALAIPMIVSGVGLLQSRAWAPKLARTMAMAAGLFAVVNLCLLRFVKVAWFGGYAIVAWQLLHRIDPAPSNCDS